MTHIFLDSNIWLRYFLQDHPQQFFLVQKLLKDIEESCFRPYTSTIVFLEVHYVLKNFYNLSLGKTLFYLEKMRETRNLTVIEETHLDKALEYYRKYKIKFSDCLIASQLPKNIILVTFDTELPRIKEINVKTPAELPKKS